MNKFVDNLLGKIDQLKRKVMTDTETNHDNKTEESAGSSDSGQKAADSSGNSTDTGAVKKERPKSRPRRKNTKPKSKAADSSGQKETAQRAKKQPPKSQAPQSGQVAKKTEKEPVIKLLINAEEPEECRIALIEDGKVESFHVTTVVHEQTKGNIYKGRVTAIEPNLQAAFVDIGTGKNVFLPFSEIHPEYYTCDKSAQKHWKDLNIQEVIKKGQEILVQVVKEAAGTKGASVTTYLSLPGRFLVLMPGSDSHGISRKIEDEEERSKLRIMMNSLNIPEGIGYIIRTASKDITKTGLNKDLRYLLRLWQETKKRGQTVQSPALIYKDQDIIAKVLRDYYTPDIQEILVDSQDAQKQVRDFLGLLPAKQRKTTVRLHQGSRPIFNQYAVEDQIEQIYQPIVKLPSGGSIVINPTEALVAIDVNSGRTAKDKNFNETIFLANMEAAAELARQLRLRDLGGLIVIDFIDMRNARHIRDVEKQVKASMKRDRAKVDISRISKFGLMQISRQKLGRPIEMGSYHACEYCQGRGVTRSVETQSLSYLRRIQTGVAHKDVVGVKCRLPIKVAQYLLNNKREELLEIEKEYGATIRIEPAPEMTPADHDIEFIKSGNDSSK
ncbi:MAG: Rne/Rng family ribonuclease [Deltaproteobacteria bacterium]|jgi:ribonuclease E|nr:Rne/Rng family ribonuclease [Deltaproteobacteria bacterium]